MQLGHLLQALAPRFDVDVVTLRVGDLPYVDRLMKARMLRVPVGSGSLVDQAEAFGRALKRQLEGEEYDVVHLRSAWGARAVFASIAPTTRVVWDVARSLEGEPTPADEEAERVLADEEEACLERADLILVPTETGREYLEGRGIGAGRAMVVPPGVDVDDFDWEPPLEEHPAWLRDVRTGRRSDEGRAMPLRMLYAGRVAAGRGIRLLLRATAILRQAYDVRLLLAGPIAPEFREALDDAIADLDIAEHVVRLGPIAHSDLPRVMAQASIGVAPSAPDLEARPLAGCPAKVLEYLACRMAVVATRRPQIADLLRDGRDGLLFRPDDAEDLAAKVGRLIEDPRLRETLADAGYWMVRSRFPAAALRRALLSVYARLVAPSEWTAPARAAEPIGAMPARLDSTTARHHLGEIDEYASFEISEVSEELESGELELIDDNATTARTERRGRRDRRGRERAERTRREEVPDFVAAGPLLGTRTTVRDHRDTTVSENPTLDDDKTPAPRE